MSETVYSYIIVKEYPRNGIDYFDIEDFSTIGIYKKDSKNFEKDFFQYWCDYFDVDDIEETEYCSQIKRAFEALTDSDFVSVSIEIDENSSIGSYCMWIRKTKEIIK